MIELVVLNDPKAKTYSFDQKTVVIGREGGANADIPIPDSSLSEVHLTISQVETKDGLTYTITNTANDPFCSFNNVPFGKRRLHKGDVIILGSTTIRCERIELPQLTQDAPLKAHETVLPQEVIPEQASAPTPQTEATPVAVEIEAPPMVFKSPKLSIKDDYLREYDDDSEANLFRKRERNTNEYSTILHAPKNWSMVAKFLAASIGAMAIIMGLLYMSVRDQSNDEELRAAKGVADVAMALTYAQVRHIHPQSHNWSDPEFVKTNLMAVLAPDYPPLAEFDSHGQFSGSQYMLRIYTGSDLKNFIVIAQPAPSVLQWLIPKASIVISSSSMEMRKIYDLKTINRLLVNASTFDIKEDRELLNLIAKGELIPLSELVTKSENQGFSPPKTLSMMHPGAENFVYNSPRYYPMSENFIDQIIAIFDHPSSNYDIGLVQQELNILNRFPYLLLYTSKGIEHATLAQKALSLLAPDEKFLLAYTQLSNKGKIHSTHILLDEFAETPSGVSGPHDVASANLPRGKVALPPEMIAEAQPKSHAKTDETSAQSSQNPSNISDPFLLQINALITSRTQALKPMNEEIAELVNAHTQNWTPHFAAALARAQEKYARIDKEQEEKITRELGAFIQEHKHLPASRFLEYIAMAKANPYFENYLDEVKSQDIAEGRKEETRAIINTRFQEVTKSMSWPTLEQNVARAANLLSFDTIPDGPTLVGYQNELSSLVIQKLNQLLLSSDQSLKPESFTSETQQTLARILELAWIEDPETQRFYLSEFDMHRP